MVGQVKVVGILMMVNGALSILMGGLYAAMGSMFVFGLPGGPPPGGGGPPPGLFAAIYGVIGGLVLLSGLLNAVAGFRVVTFRNRVLGIIALFSNLLALFTCYCMVTGVAMMVYGLIVLFHSDVARAFDLVSRGATPEEAIGQCTRVYDDARDDYDEISSPRSEWEDRRRRRRQDPSVDDSDEGR
jgi:hypothetical protein